MHRFPLIYRLLLAGALALLSACAHIDTPGVLPRSFSPALERAMPSVVGVYGVDSQAERMGELSLTAGTIGAGFFVDGDGTVVTAAHVTSDYDTIVVRLADQRIFLAEKVFEDVDLDIAVIRIPLSGTPAAPVGNASGLRPGDWVLAVGEPFGLRRSAVAGIVGGALRHFGEDAEGMFIQTNIALNPGNSGGPLLDLKGAVLGMNVRTVIGASGTGVSLSVPIDVIFQIRDEARNGTRRPRLGARFEDVAPPVAHASGLATTRGALISEVLTDGPAARAGLRVGDVVTQMNGVDVTDSTDLSRRIFAWRATAGVRLTVVRERRLTTVNLD